MMFSNTQNPFLTAKTNPITKDKKDEVSTRKFRQFIEESLNKVPISKKIFKSRNLFGSKKDGLNVFQP